MLNFVKPDCFKWNSLALIMLTISKPESFEPTFHKCIFILFVLSFTLLFYTLQLRKLFNV